MTEQPPPGQCIQIQPGEQGLRQGILGEAIAEVLVGLHHRRTRRADQQFGPSVPGQVGEVNDCPGIDGQRRMVVEEHRLGEAGDAAVAELIAFLGHARSVSWS